MNMALMHGPAWQNYEITSRGDGSTTVRIQTGDGFAASAAIRREEVSLEFETLEQALDRAGTSRISACGSHRHGHGRARRRAESSRVNLTA
jgi:hypothetical protein